MKYKINCKKLEEGMNGSNNPKNHHNIAKRLKKQGVKI